MSEEVDPAATSHEISAHETVETSPVESARTISSIGTNISHNILLGRWRLSLDLFGRVFMEDVGLEAGSVVSELGGFPVKEAKFRRDMEKLRNSQQKDITIKVYVTKSYNLSKEYDIFCPRICTVISFKYKLLNHTINRWNEIEHSY